MRGEVRAAGGGRACGGAAAADAACTEKARLKTLGARARAEPAHEEHVAHVRDAGRVPAGNVRVEILQVPEEV